ncbi:MAG: 50S ribosomal protein L32e [Thermoplasmata archaeon]|nr:50S ribosomal protein L32e [Thermoplasmata archaeon]
MNDKEEFIKKLTSIEGIGRAKALQIYENNFDSIEKIKKASIEDLAKIKGISKDLAKKIKDNLETKETEEAKTTEKEEKIEKKEEEVEIVEKEKKYEVKIKPELLPQIKKALRIKKTLKKKKPEFLRQEWFRYKRLSENWRKPKGLTSKMRKHMKYRISTVKIGFRSPREARYLHPSGFEEITVCNVKDLEKIDGKRQAARISGTVGTRKRIEIEKKADEMGIRILNKLNK